MIKHKKIKHSYLNRYCKCVWYYLKYTKWKTALYTMDERKHLLKGLLKAIICATSLRNIEMTAFVCHLNCMSYEKI